MNAFGLILLPVVVPNIKYIYPMEVKFFNDSSTNYYINFGIQTVGYFEAAMIFFVFVLIFIIFTMNLLCELEIVAGLCQQIGDYEEKTLSLVAITEETSSVKSSSYSNILEETGEDLTSESTFDFKDKINNINLESKLLLGVMIKYHANVLQ